MNFIEACHEHAQGKRVRMTANTGAVGELLFTANGYRIFWTDTNRVEGVFADAIDGEWTLFVEQAQAAPASKQTTIFEKIKKGNEE